ncbi:MAG: hypothetical protein DWQ40_01690 [Actinobacteria bacterium]|nr:MAG: hypothetical protein DWQ40_01690 [Actinomycetota bacterium]REK39029.1 MAG: hypothetical protein DWQ20_03135 [Actinomycetota bacterium]
MRSVQEQNGNHEGVATDETVSEIEEIRERLAAIQRRTQVEDLPSDRREELVDQEHRLEARLRQLSDEVVEKESGLAEDLVDEEGADADEFPALPDETTDQ